MASSVAIGGISGMAPLPDRTSERRYETPTSVVTAASVSGRASTIKTKLASFTAAASSRRPFRSTRYLLFAGACHAPRCIPPSSSSNSPVTERAPSTSHNTASATSSALLAR